MKISTKAWLYLIVTTVMAVVLFFPLATVLPLFTETDPLPAADK